jgi:hypothetical protein
MPLIFLAIFIGLSVLFVVTTLVFWSRSNKLKIALGEESENHRLVSAKVSALTSEKIALDNQYAIKLVRFSRIIDLEKEESQTSRRIAELTASEQSLAKEFDRSKNQRLEEGKAIELQILAARDELSKLSETLDLQSFGFYQNRYDLETPEAYKDRLDGVKFAQKQMIQGKIAASCDAEWQINGSRTEGRKHINQMLKLLARGFNGEADAAIAKVKYSNVVVMEERIRKSYEVFNKMGSHQHCYINPDYFALKLHELHLVHEYREKLNQVKEEQREIRAQMREEEKARREIAKALEDASKDEARYNEALEEARLEVETAVGSRQEKLLAHIGNLERKLTEALTMKERALSRAQLTRSGHVYVVSNLGSFGDDVYKIGMTRRLDPFDRVLELGDASVPFRFDVHAIIYCDDAPSLETKLHRKFHNRRLNRVNYRKEFFRVSLAEIASAVREFHGDIEFTSLAEAEEFRKSLVQQPSPLEPSIESKDVFLSNPDDDENPLELD